MRSRFIGVCSIVIIVCCLSFCVNKNEHEHSAEKRDCINGKLFIFHAGSLTVPVKIICDSFKKVYPDIAILTEACGSKQCARNISDLNKECDVFISADYKVIDNMLVPKYAAWNIPFASNEMTIVYNKNSKYAGEINKENWFEILLRKDVVYGRSDPNSDPCGVRAVLATKLSEKFYKKKKLAEKLLQKDNNYIRPKETDLLALLETNTVDYIFLYRSVAQQHKLEYIILPDEVNLKKQELSELYKTVSVEVSGKKPDEKTMETGEAMIYGITIPSAAENRKAADAFVDYFLDKGMKIIEDNGQPSVIPSMTKTYDQVPDQWKKYVTKPVKDEVQ
jgi:molybdate/tungstate transport system substrate-binding protein